jgi:hypothetical protein
MGEQVAATKSMREESAYGGAGTCHHMWEKIPMNDRPCVIMEERKNPPIREQRAVTIWRRKDTHRDRESLRAVEFNSRVEFGYCT